MMRRITKIFGLLAITASVSQSLAQTTYTWNPAGPIYTAGRARNIIIDKTDASGKTLYVGSSSSGVFKSINGGVTWNPVNDQGKIRNISYMAQDISGTIWVGTGEGFLRWGQKTKAQSGTGLYKLDQSTSQLVQIKDATVTGAVINRIACSPANANVIALATSKGILVSLDGGSSFSSPVGQLTHSLSMGMDVKFDNTGILYCSQGSELAYSVPAAGIDYGSISSKVFKSTDNQLSALTDITPTNAALPNSVYGRIELAIAPSDNSCIYASCSAKSTSNPTTATQGSESSASMKALFVSYNGGSSWGMAVQGSPANDPLMNMNGGTIASGDYAQVLSVLPGTKDVLVFGGYRLFIFARNGGTDANPIFSYYQLGTNLINTSPYYLHENIHDIRFFPGSNGFYTTYLVTDAGIFRTTDFFPMSYSTQVFGGSFQPFYKGLVTGQFNSVSIERFPVGANTGTSAASGQSVQPYSGFIGGTGGNGLSYYSGKADVVTQETNYLGGEVYNAEFSRILDGAVLLSNSNGGIYRSSNIKTSSPSLVNSNKYTGSSISVISPNALGFQNNNVSTGTPFKLWENYGQLAVSPDSAVFYNDTSRVGAGVALDIATLNSQTTFTFAAGRPNPRAMIDSVVIRTTTVTVPVSNSYSVCPTPLAGADRRDVNIKLQNNYPYSLTGTSVPQISGVLGLVNGTAAVGVTLSPVDQFDLIKVTFNTAPFATYTTPFYPYSATAQASNATVPNAAAYYKVYATIFYKYKAGDEVSVIDNNISTKTYTYTGNLTKDLRWTKTSANLSLDPKGPKNGINPTPVVNRATNPLFKIPTLRSARLAIVLNNPDFTNNGANSAYAIVVAKNALNLNDPLNFVRISQSGCYSDDSQGKASTQTITIPGRPTMLEWSKAGTELYYATDDNKVYRVSHITDIMDLSSSSYSGKFYTDVFSYPINSGVLNPNCPYRTTLLGTFTKPISSIALSKDDKNIVVTFNNPNPASSATTEAMVVSNTNDIRVSDASNIGWTREDDSNLAGNVIYCSLVEKNDPSKVFVGTDNGVFYTSNITASGAAAWTNVNNISVAGGKLPNVQVFDIKQQQMDSWDCYNSGQIYIATNGRGVWTTSNFLAGYYTGIENNSLRERGTNNLSVFPNPGNHQVTISFDAVDGEHATLQIMDLSGRIVKSETIGNQLNTGETNYSFYVSDLNPGIYLVNVNSNAGIKRTAKLIVSK